MCGISGFNFSHEQLIKEMVQSLKHRGPDDEGIYCDQNVSLGHNRLAIIDLSAAGHQPMVSRDKNLVIVYNGELYNFSALRKELEMRGRTFVSQSDTEVVLQSYDEYGPACLNKFNGIFAFAIWDKTRRELFLARDHFGVKPLFYYYDGKRLIFASEIKAILKHQIKRELNWRQINLFFHLLYSKGPETVWQKIYKLPPGHYLRWRRGIGLEIKKYWQLNSSAPRFGNIEEIQENIRELLRSSVARQLVADVPVGVFLSGGIDSTAILGLMAERTRAPIKTFSVGFKVDQRNFEKFNQDAILARLTAGRYNAEHYEVMLGPEEVIQHFEKVVWHMDDLVYSPTQVANFVLAKLARRYVKVVLGGDGGDELFGGYRRYYYYWWYQHLRIIPSWLRGSAAVRRLFEFWGQDKAVNRLNLEPQELHWSFMSQKDRLLNQVLRPDLQKFTLNAKQYFYQDGLFNQPLEGDFVNKMMIFDLKTWLPDFSLARTDKMGMAVGLEERVPFLDKHLADFAMQIPSRFKIGNASGGKKVLRQALRGYLPPEIYKKDKSGWITPTAKWIRGGLKDYIQEVLSDSFSQEDGNLIDWQQARRLFTQHLAGRVYAPHIIWSLVTFRVWYKMFKQI